MSSPPRVFWWKGWSQAGLGAAQGLLAPLGFDPKELERKPTLLAWLAFGRMLRCPAALGAATVAAAMMMVGTIISKLHRPGNIFAKS